MPSARAGSESVPGRRRLAPQLLAGALVGVLAGLLAATLIWGGSEPSAAAWADARYRRFDGTTATLSDHRGRPLVVNFWASWCTPCLDELPDLEAAHRRWRDEVDFVGLTHRDDQDHARALATRAGVTYELAEDPGSELYRELRLFAMPSTVFIAADGTVVDVVTGRVDAEQLEGTLQDLTSGR